MAEHYESGPCDYCEGTGKKLNYYDPPKDMAKQRVVIPGMQYTRNGREILDGPCPVCNGSKILTYAV